jgi:uncharacterized integral membrane protein
MASPYKRRRPSIVRNFWVYRRLVGLAMVLGLLLWFIWANNTPVTVSFPFRLGTWKSTIGLVILMSALAGSGSTLLLLTIIYTWRRVQSSSHRGSPRLGGSASDDFRRPSARRLRCESVRCAPGTAIQLVLSRE